MNALELLKADHEKVDALFQKVKANEDGDNTAIAEQIIQELKVHTHIEEAIFYPRLLEEGDEELQKIVKEGIEEHRQAKGVMKQIEGLSEGSENIQAKLQVLMEDIEHHVMEEEGEMFTMVQEQFDETTLEELGTEMEEEKTKVQKSSSAAAK
jgi:hemerythrin-like domain-containing protein